MVRREGGDLGIGHGRRLHVSQHVQALGVLQPHPCLAVAFGENEGRQEGKGLRVLPCGVIAAIRQ